MHIKNPTKEYYFDFGLQMNEHKIGLNEKNSKRNRLNIQIQNKKLVERK